MRKHTFNEANLNWFLEFMNLDIKNLYDGDRQKWITEAIYIIEFGRPSLGLKRYGGHSREEFEGKIEKWSQQSILDQCQKKIKEFLENLYINIEESASSRSNFTIREKFKFSSVLQKFEVRTNIKIQIPVTAGIEHRIVNENKDNEEWYHKVNKNKFYRSNFHISFESDNDEENFFLAFCFSLQGVTINSIRKCPECEKWYLHLSKKQKIYCSSQCASRFGMRTKRKKLKTENPDIHENYKKKSAKRARKSYERKMKKNNPKAKIGRRPTKYSD